MNNFNILKLFPEPVFKFKVEEYQTLNKDLAEYIYNLREKENVGLKRSNRGGWHSENFKLGFKNTIQNNFALTVQKYIISAFQNYGWKTKDVAIRIKEMWAIINKKNDFNVLHTHPNCYLSAAYYVKAPKNCGRFQLECPNIAKRHFYPQIQNLNELNIGVVAIDVEEGDLLLFPAYLPHKVAKNESEEDRIVISFNVDVE